jgi:hypothetical protein
VGAKNTFEIVFPLESVWNESVNKTLEPLMLLSSNPIGRHKHPHTQRREREITGKKDSGRVSYRLAHIVIEILVILSKNLSPSNCSTTTNQTKEGRQNHILKKRGEEAGSMQSLV